MAQIKQESLSFMSCIGAIKLFKADILKVTISIKINW